MSRKELESLGRVAIAQIEKLPVKRFKLITKLSRIDVLLCLLHCLHQVIVYQSIGY
ncbi:MAG: hypothetical protein ACRC78_17330 [Planktothrix sp.]